MCQFVHSVAQPGGLECLDRLVVVVHTEVGFQNKVLDRLYLKECIAEHAPVLVFVVLAVLYQTHDVRCVSQHIIDLVHIHAISVIHGFGGMLFHGVFLRTVRHVMGFPPVDSHIAANLETVVEKTVVGGETGVHALEIGPFHDSVVVEETQREGRGSIFRASVQSHTVGLHQRCPVYFVFPIGALRRDVRSVQVLVGLERCGRTVAVDRRRRSGSAVSVLVG